MEELRAKVNNVNDPPDGNLFIQPVRTKWRLPPVIKVVGKYRTRIYRLIDNFLGLGAIILSGLPSLASAGFKGFTFDRKIDEKPQSFMNILHPCPYSKEQLTQ